MDAITNAIYALVKEIRAMRYILAIIAGKAQIDRMDAVRKEEGEESDNWKDVDEFAEMLMDDAEEKTGYYKE